MTRAVIGFALAIAIAGSASAQTLVAADFETGTQGFAYLDDAFYGTSRPAYASGGRDPSGGFAGAGLWVDLGGRDDVSVVDGMSAGWQRGFSLVGDDTVTVRFRYRFVFPTAWAPPDVFEIDECGRVLASIDGVLLGPGAVPFWEEFCGATGAAQDTGWRLASVDVPLSAGDHLLTLGALLGKKTWPNESMRVYFDDVEIEAQGLVPGTETECADGLDNDADGLGDCDDADCAGAAACQPEAVCDDGVDDDLDGLVDCADPDCAGACSYLLDEHFDAGPGGFAYADDVFRGSARPAYAAGAHDPAGGFTGGALRVVTGGIDGVHVTDGMSGGWTAGFGLSGDDTVTLSFRYRLVFPSDWNPPDVFEIDECGQALVAVDGVLLAPGAEDFLVELCGATGAGQDTGWVPVSLELPLSAGPHAVTLGMWLNKKTYPDEESRVLFDDVLVVAHGLLPPQETACADGLDNDADGAVDCADADCTGAAACLPEAVCDDGLDDEGDGLADCADPDCAGDPICEPGGELTCGDGFDNDGDGDADCADADCGGALACPLLFSADFESGTDGFGYADDVIAGTARPAYADGQRDAAGGFAGAGLRVDLGGLDDVVVGDGMSGGWARSFTLLGDDTVTLRFRYRFVFPTNWLPPDVFEVDECGRVLATVDGVPVGPGGQPFWVELCGATGGGQDTGWVLATADVPLAAGPHVLELGAFLNKKTWPNESTVVFVDDVELTAHGLVPASEGVCDDGLDNDADGLADCADADCAGALSCEPGGELSCDDGLDNDGDGLADCADPDCGGEAYCEPGTELSCDDGLDNDADGLVDCADMDCAGLSSCTAPLNASFAADAQGFTYADDLFRGTSNPAYASGEYSPSGGEAGGALHVRVGGIDDTDVTDGMSGGWMRDFALPEADLVTVTLRYRLVMAGTYEPDECAELLVALDGRLASPPPDEALDGYCGIASYDDQDTGWVEQRFEWPLGGGAHTLAVGLWNGQKTTASERTDLYVGELRVERAGETVLLFDDFEQADPAWVEVDDSGRGMDWSLEDGFYRQSQAKTDTFEGASARGSFVYHAPSTGLSDYRVRLRARPLQDVGGSYRDHVGVLFRYQDPSNYYRFAMSRRQGYRRLERRVGGVFETLAFDGRGFGEKARLDVRVDVVGDQIVVAVDGETLFAVSDSSLATGSVALYAQSKAEFDHILVTAPPSEATVALSEPVSHTVAIADAGSGPWTLTAAALARNVPVGASARFVLDAGGPGETQIVDPMAPFGASFPGVGPGDHSVDVALEDGGGGALAADASATVGAGGVVGVGFGDSITSGVGDGWRFDDRSFDGRHWSRGYTPILADGLAAETGRPTAVYNEGFGGTTAASGAGRIDETLVRHPLARFWLVLFGTNDSNGSLPVPSGAGCSEADLQAGDPACAGTYKESMRAVVLSILASGHVPVLGKVPYIKGGSGARLALVQEYNSVIDQLVAEHGLPVPSPDFYVHYEQHQDEFYDALHPNGPGYAAMAGLWLDVLVQSGLLD